MTKIARFVIWICSKFNRNEIEHIIIGLLEVITDRNPDVKPKDSFKEHHPHYRNFSVDPQPPLCKQPVSQSTQNYKQILAEYLINHDKPFSPVTIRTDSKKVPQHISCPHCKAPHSYIYYNNGKKYSQFKCKVCNSTFSSKQKLLTTKYFCPYCHHALFTWKQRLEVTIYKCGNDSCQHRMNALANLNANEQSLQKQKSSQFKLNYQYREYHFKQHQLKHSSPHKPKIDITKIHNSQDVLGLILTFYVSFAISARKTALILRSVFNIYLSYQTVLNYAEAAASYCHLFNFQHKGPIDALCAGDETYIKIKGMHHYAFLFMCAKSLKISSYHIANNRSVLPATAALTETIRTAQPDQQITIITDANPAYGAAIHFLNAQETLNPKIKHRKVIGLQNLDQESEEFRPFKQLIERLNRTYKHHIKPAHGFNSSNGAVALTTLFVTHYNFLRPHSSLKHKTPVQLPELQTVSTIQSKWAKILSLAA